MSNFEKLQRRLAAGETILMDGGMSSELGRRGLEAHQMVGRSDADPSRVGEGHSPGVLEIVKKNWPGTFGAYAHCLARVARPLEIMPWTHGSTWNRLRRGESRGRG